MLPPWMIAWEGTRRNFNLVLSPSKPENVTELMVASTAVGCGRQPEAEGWQIAYAVSNAGATEITKIIAEE